MNEPTIPQLEARIAKLEAFNRNLARALAGGTGPMIGDSAGPRVAPDSDLDSRFGDEEVRFVPKNWKGQNFKGHKMSETSPEFLEMLAESYEWFATKSEEKNELTKDGKPKAQYDRRAASRARGWAQRLAKSPRPAQSAAPPTPSNAKPAWMTAQPNVPGPPADEDGDIPFVFNMTLIGGDRP